MVVLGAVLGEFWPDPDPIVAFGSPFAAAVLRESVAPGSLAWPMNVRSLAPSVELSVDVEAPLWTGTP